MEKGVDNQGLFLYFAAPLLQERLQQRLRENQARKKRLTGRVKRDRVPAPAGEPEGNTFAWRIDL